MTGHLATKERDATMKLQAPAPMAIVVFGASGDLTRKKILPGLYNLFVEGLLPERHTIIGYAFSEWSDHDFREHARASISEFSRTGIDADAFERFAPALSFVPGKFDDPTGFQALAARLQQADQES